MPKPLPPRNQCTCWFTIVIHTNKCGWVVSLSLIWSVWAAPFTWVLKRWSGPLLHNYLLVPNIQVTSSTVGHKPEKLKRQLPCRRSLWTLRASPPLAPTGTPTALPVDFGRQGLPPVTRQRWKAGRSRQTDLLGREDAVTISPLQTPENSGILSGAAL